MARRFRIWEAGLSTQNQSVVSPTRSMAVNVSNSHSFLSTGDVGESRSSQPYVAPVGFRKRQLIVAVTANSAECEKVNEGGFDEICPKPLTRADIHKIITRYFQYE
uniref:Uncharacterized protein n=1 Tax=Spumella elongata TaxID=89044 RepID=A0A7S3HJ08_9STRA|eukprot:CAMPEP_0184997652 /NCGR_PEP_ID=MMETSP1098-20130426/60164_1 /TAXON_ID=89044 /ORGANISM="Spumella elongata, Strain CCAP 955/1" /LENGTH=105 /DNA_ID=CAMNT_0027524327 /DNA_START=83 /DNA_END=400 /DNA_ORIENTATION=+